TLDYVNVKEMEKRVKSIAKMLGIEHILSKRTYEISGGQAQRVAIARAMIHQPKLVLADEPTGNLDSKASKDVMQLLSMMNEEQNTTLLLVTHEAQAAMYADRVIFIRDGKLYSEIYQEGYRHVFFQKIIDTLSAIGGNAYDTYTTCIKQCSSQSTYLRSIFVTQFIHFHGFFLFCKFRLSSSFNR